MEQNPSWLTKNSQEFVIFEVFTAVSMKNGFFWDVAPCRYCVNQQTLVPRSRIFMPWGWRPYVPPKRRLTQYLHGAPSQKTTFFIVKKFLAFYRIRRFITIFTVSHHWNLYWVKLIRSPNPPFWPLVSQISLLQVLRLNLCTEFLAFTSATFPANLILPEATIVIIIHAEQNLRSWNPTGDESKRVNKTASPSTQS
jgi:hypothetical protein